MHENEGRRRKKKNNEREEGGRTVGRGRGKAGRKIGREKR